MVGQVMINKLDLCKWIGKVAQIKEYHGSYHAYERIEEIEKDFINLLSCGKLEGSGL